jgi:alkylation response protein AidB-like acyl-CoA dehydrogenase
MDFTLTPTQREWQTRASALGAELAPDAPAQHIITGAARRGLLDPEADLLTAAIATDALAHGSAAAGIAVALHIGVIRAMRGYSGLRSLVNGERVGALALASDHYPTVSQRLIGRASWVAPMTPHGIAVIGATIDGRLVAFAVMLEPPGVTMEPVSTVALDGLVCGHLVLNEAPAAPLGPTQPIMARVRVLLAAAGLGMGRRALSEALQIARAYNRTGAGGEQTVQGLLADTATELDAATMLTWKAAGAPEPSLADASMAKLAATEATQRAVARATQVIGGDSFTAGHVIDRLARDVRALELFAGRTEALREAVAIDVLADETERIRGRG